MRKEPTSEPEGYEDIRREIRRLGGAFPGRYRRDLDRTKTYPSEFVAALTAGGWLAALIPEQYGGAGLGLGAAAAIMEEIQRSGCNGAACHAQMYMMGTLLRHGNDAQKEKYLPAIARGDLRLQAFGITEPSSGTDTASLATTAVRSGDGYLINGQKIWTSRAEHSDLMLVLARTTPLDQVRKRTDGLSIFLLDMREARDNGLVVRPIETMMNHSTTEVFFENVPVPASQMIGAEGAGFRCVLSGMNAERILIAAECVGDGKWFVEKASKYASERVVFGRPIAQNQGVQFPIAKAYARLRAAELMVHRAAELYESQRDCGPEANMAKLLAAEASWEAGEACLQTHGGLGFAAEFDVERKFRETRLYQVAPISTNLILSYIAEHVLGMPLVLLMADAPLGGLTVLALEQAVAAPFCTMRLADAGARVIKVERPDGDFARYYDEATPAGSSYFVWLNRGKELVVLDLTQAGDKSRLSELIGRADILVQNLKPGAMARMGFPSEELKRRFPRLIRCSISGYGDQGPLANRKAYDLLVQAESGLASITGGPDAPSRVGISIVDIATGATAYAAILEALIRRHGTGVGADIRLSMFDVMADWLTAPLLAAEAGRPPRRIGLAHPSIAPYGLFPTLDGRQLLIAAQSDREWRLLCSDVIGRPELGDDPRFATNIQRAANRSETDGVVASFVGARDAEEVVRRLDAADIAFAELNEIENLAGHPHLTRISIETAAGSLSLPRPAAIHDQEARRYGPVPALGQHTEAVLSELCGKDRDHE